MEITLKNVKHSEFASQETHCFEATVYVDGKRSFIVSNDGHGGCDSYRPINNKKTYSQVNDEVANIDECLALNREPHTFGGTCSITHSLEIEIGDLVNDWLFGKDFKKTMKKVAFIKDGAIHTLKGSIKPTLEILAKVKNTPWWKPEYILLNDLREKEAFARFKLAMK